MVSEEMGLRRLDTLAYHLKKGILGHKIFDVSFYNSGGNPWLGERGDALGECPIIWDEWIFDKQGYPVYKGYPNSFLSAMRFFDCNEELTLHLFYAFEQQPLLYGGRRISLTSTAEEVANNIYSYLSLKTKKVC